MKHTYSLQNIMRNDVYRRASLYAQKELGNIFFRIQAYIDPEGPDGNDYADHIIRAYAECFDDRAGEPYIGMLG